MKLVPINNAPPEPGSNLDYALRYAALGWKILPVWHVENGRCQCSEKCPSKNPGKHPAGHLVPNGVLDAVADPATIRRWWTLYPKASIGIAMAASGLVAIDVDPRNGGIETMEMLEAKHGPIASDVLQFSGGGGEHRVFHRPDGELPGSLGPGVDVKANGYILAEPSTHMSGRRYAWEASSDPLEGAIPSPCPDLLRDFARRRLELPAQDVPRAPVDPGLVLELSSALQAIPADDRDVWLQVGMAIHNEIGGQVGFDLWRSWSETSTKFDPVDQVRVWRSFKRIGMAGVGKGTIFRAAQDRGWHNPGPATAIEPVLAVPPAAVATQAPPAPISQNLLTVPGILGLAVDWINATARKPQPAFAVQAALALGSTVLGRRFRTDNANWPALYFLNVGPSGCGKEHAKHAVERALEAAGLGRLIGVSRYASESGLISSLLEKPTQFSSLDEFGKMLQAASVASNYADRNTLKGLMEVWGRAHGVIRPTGYSTAGLSSKQAEELAKRVVRCPSLTLLAMTTPATLFAGITTDAIADGFLNRFITVHSDVGRQIEREVADVEPPDALIAWMQEARTHGAGNLQAFETPHDTEPTPTVLAFDAQAKAIFADFKRRMHARMDELEAELMDEMLMRATETAMRVALIVAWSIKSPTVDGLSAEWACAYVETHAERNLLEIRSHIADGPFNGLCKAIMRVAIKAGAAGVTERDLDRLSREWRRFPARAQQEALQVLQRQERLALVVTKKPGQRGGRARSAYVALADDEVQSSTNVDETPT